MAVVLPESFSATTMQRFVQIALLLAALIVGGAIVLWPGETPAEPANNPEDSQVLPETSATKMLAYVESKIAKQEDVKDVRCWSSVNKIQTFLSGMPIELEAIGQRVERYVELIEDVWISSGKNAAGSEIQESELMSALNGQFANRISDENGKITLDADEGFAPIEGLEDSVRDYSDTIESWRLLQSWALRKASAGPSGEGGTEKAFSEPSLTKFRDFLVVFDIALLQSAKEVAMERKQGSVDVESMNIAFDRLLAGKANESKETNDLN